MSNPSSVGYAAGIRRNAGTWTSYGLLVATAYLLYGIGYATPYVRADLGISDAAAALASSAAAAGMIGAGAVAGPIQHRIGALIASRCWLALVSLAAVGLASAPSYAGLLASAVLFGFGSGALLAHVNRVLGTDPKAIAERHVARANVWAMVGGFVAATAIAMAASGGLGGRIALLAPLPLFAVLMVAVAATVQLTGSPALSTAASEGTQPAQPRPSTGTEHLPPGYWISWSFTVLIVMLEFEFVVFGASVVADRAHIATTVATSLASIFVGGEFLGRLALGAGLGRVVETRTMLRGGLGLVVVASLLVAVAADEALAGIAFLAGGLGVATLYPLSVVMSLAQAPGAPVLASTRLSLASGGGILAAPLLLGSAAQAGGLLVAWLLVPATALLALAALTRVPERRATDNPPLETA